MNRQRAYARAEERATIWNARDLGSIMSHYAPEIRFVATTVIGHWDKADGVLVGKDELRRHFARGLELAPDVHFELIDVPTGVGGATVLYRRETGTSVADLVVFDENYKGLDARLLYAGTRLETNRKRG